MSLIFHAFSPLGYLPHLLLAALYVAAKLFQRFVSSPPFFFSLAFSHIILYWSPKFLKLILCCCCCISSSKHFVFVLELGIAVFIRAFHYVS